MYAKRPLQITLPLSPYVHYNVAPVIIDNGHLYKEPHPSLLLNYTPTGRSASLVLLDLFFDVINTSRDDID